MALTTKQVQDVCFIFGGYRQCRYLDEDVNDKGDSIFLCKKLSADRKIIDEEFTDFLLENKDNGKDITKMDMPLADNCKGFIVLREKKQGFDTN